MVGTCRQYLKDRPPQKFVLKWSPGTLEHDVFFSRGYGVNVALPRLHCLKDVRHDTVHTKTSFGSKNLGATWQAAGQIIGVLSLSEFTKGGRCHWRTDGFGVAGAQFMETC